MTATYRAQKIAAGLTHLAQANLALSRGLAHLAGATVDKKVGKELERYSRSLRRLAETIDKAAMAVERE